MIMDFIISFISTIVIVNIINSIYNCKYPKHNGIYYLLKDRRAKTKNCPGCDICYRSFRGRRNIGEVVGVTTMDSFR